MTTVFEEDAIPKDKFAKRGKNYLIELINQNHGILEAWPRRKERMGTSGPATQLAVGPRISVPKLY